MTCKAEMLVPGKARGPVLRLTAPISFWGGVDPATGRITLASHPERGECISDRILVIPRLVGSSSSSAVLLELIHLGKAPLGLILGERDAILPVGVIVAGQMEWPQIPVALLPDPGFSTGQTLSIEPDGTISEV